MSETSLPLLRTLKLRPFPKVVRRTLGKLFGYKKAGPMPDAAASPEVTLQAASTIRAYAGEHAALFEREERLRAKAERLRDAGTPSESANNRAERARMELEAGLLALRERFAPSAGEKRHAFEHELGRLYPGLVITGR